MFWEITQNYIAQQAYVGHLPCAKYWSYSRKQDRQGFCPHGIYRLVRAVDNEHVANK